MKKSKPAKSIAPAKTEKTRRIIKRNLTRFKYSSIEYLLCKTTQGSRGISIEKITTGMDTKEPKELLMLVSDIEIGNPDWFILCRHFLDSPEGKLTSFIGEVKPKKVSLKPSLRDESFLCSAMYFIFPKK